MNVKKIILLYFIVSISVISNITFTLQYTHSYNNIRLSEYSIRHSKNENNILLNQETSEEKVDIIKLGIVIIANLSKTFWTTVRYNNSFIYAKTHVFVYVNNILNKTITRNSNTNKIIIKLDNSIIIEKIIWINSYRDIEEIEKDFEGILVYPSDLVRIAITGIPAFLVALLIAILTLVIKREYVDVKEGFEND